MLCYHTSNLHECMGESMGEALLLHAIYKKPFFFYCKSCENSYQCYKSCENPYQVLQVTWESVSGTTSHAYFTSSVRQVPKLSKTDWSIKLKNLFLSSVKVWHCFNFQAHVQLLHSNPETIKLFCFIFSRRKRGWKKGRKSRLVSCTDHSYTHWV